MTYEIYFERDPLENHIRLQEWRDVIAHTDGVRQVAPDATDFENWIGYWKNPRSSGGEFHEMEDRRYDAEVFIPEEGKWRRAIYWHFARPDYDGGVITFEDCRVDSTIYQAALALATLLNARLVDQDETQYEEN